MTKPITVAVFPDAGHGIYEYETGPDGKRTETGNSEGYFAMMRDFILRGRLDERDYGDSAVFPAGQVRDAAVRRR